jgi:hypothetical protein
MEWGKNDSEEIVQQSVNIEYVVVIKFSKFYKEKGRQFIQFFTEERNPNTREIENGYKMDWQLCKLYKHWAKKRNNQTDEEYFNYLKPFLSDIYKRWRENYLNMAMDFALDEVANNIQTKKTHLDELDQKEQ